MSEFDNETSRRCRKLQIKGFKAYYNAAIAGGVDLRTAFVNAIVNTSDERMRVIIKNNPDVVNEFFAGKRENRGNRKAS